MPTTTEKSVVPFEEASDDICHALDLLTRKLCTQAVHHSILAPFLACHLIALNKIPGISTISIFEVPRQITSKAILYVIKGDIQEEASVNQICGRQIAGAKAALNAMRQLFSFERVEGIIFADASNEFNSLNCAR